VAMQEGLVLHVTPPGDWRSIDNLLDGGLIDLFVHDGFGIGGGINHARSPDAVFAALAVLTMVAADEAGWGPEGPIKRMSSELHLKAKPPPVSLETLKSQPSGPSVPKAICANSLAAVLAKPESENAEEKVKKQKTYASHLLIVEEENTTEMVSNPLRSLLNDHWAQFGRNYHVRMDYDACDVSKAIEMFEKLQIKIRTPILFAHAWFHYGPHSYQVIRGEDFEYVDPVTSTVALSSSITNCIRIFLHDGSTIVYRLCNADEGANFRIHVNKRETSMFKMWNSRDKTLEPLVNIAVEMAEVNHFLGKAEPDYKV